MVVVAAVAALAVVVAGRPNSLERTYTVITIQGQSAIRFAAGSRLA